MKELSIEEKACRYDEALERARKINSVEGVETSPNWTICEVIFPELKEPDSDRIRKALVDYFNDAIKANENPLLIYGIHNDRVIVWLEAQAEHANFRNNIQIGDRVTRNEAGILVNISQLNRVAKERKEQEESQVYETKDGKVITYSETDGYKVEQKPAEQKPADKVQPKFRNGQWIVWKDKCYKVTDNECGYELIDQNGLSTSLEYGTVDDNAHLWDITKDAKDGDVLYHKAENGIEYIVMSKGLNEFNNIDSYFRYNSIDGFSIDVPSVLSAKCDSITPATKEQRDLLFQKMREAGYEWDADKKELKKIEQKPAEWSEEDNSRIDNLCHFLEEYGNQYYGHLTLQGTISWLKSLRPQSQWKPSKEQMKYLHKYAEQNNYDGAILTSLYNDLKKLKDEK